MPPVHFDALRPAALREGGRTEETLATENEREMLIRKLAHVYTQPTQLFSAGAHLRPTSNPLRELAR